MTSFNDQKFLILVKSNYQQFYGVSYCMIYMEFKNRPTNETFKDMRNTFLLHWSTCAVVRPDWVVGRVMEWVERGTAGWSSMDYIENT